MRRSPTLAALALAAGTLAATPAAAHDHGPAATPTITLVSAAAAANRHVVVEVRIAGWKMQTDEVGKAVTAGGGHWHIYLNGRYNAYSVDPVVGVSAKLRPGTYAVTAELANNDHSAVPNTTRTRAITVRVR